MRTGTDVENKRYARYSHYGPMCIHMNRDKDDKELVNEWDSLHNIRTGMSICLKEVKKETIELRMLVRGLL